VGEPGAMNWQSEYFALYMYVQKIAELTGRSPILVRGEIDDIAVKTGERASRVAALEYAKVLEGRTDGDVRGIS